MNCTTTNACGDKTRDRVRLAFVNQPWNQAVPPVDSGSVAIWTYQVARSLAADADLAVVSRRVPGVQTMITHDGVCYRRVPSRPEPFGPVARLRRLFVNDSVLPRFATPNYYAAYFRRVASDLAFWCPDVVHVHNLFQALPVLHDKLPKARIVLHMHCEWLSQLPSEHVKSYLQAADWIATCSDHVREALTDALPEWFDRSSTLPNGVDTTAFAPCDERSSVISPKTILFVGRISPEKGIHLLIGAFQKIAERFDDVKLLIVGPDAPTPAEFLVDLSVDSVVKDLQRFYGAETYGNTLRKQVPDYLADRVSFAGAVSHAELRDLYRNAAVLVNPSLSESFGMSVIEAMACGCPVVVARTGGMKSVVRHEVNGLVVSPSDSDALAASVSRLLADPVLARRLAAAGRMHTVELYDWTKVAAQTLELHRRLWGGSR